MMTQTQTQPTTRPPRWRQIALSIVLLAASAGGGFLFATVLFSNPTMDAVADEVPLWAFLGILVLGVFLPLALHEVGHLIGGLLVGFRFALFVVGPIKIYRAGDGIRFELNRHLGLIGGVAASYPTDSRDLTRRMAVVTAAGPAMSVLLVVLGAVTLWLLPPQVAPELWLLTVMVVLGSAGVFLGVMIPSRTSGFLTDRARLQLLLRGDAASQRSAAALAVTSATMSGVRPRDWDRTLIEQGIAHQDGILDDLTGHLFAYAHFLDSGEVERAGAALDYVLARATDLPGLMQPGLSLEAAYFAATHRQDAAAARQWFAQGKGGMVDPHNRLRAEAAVLLVEGDHAAARAKAEEGLRLIHRASEPGSAVMEVDALQKIRDWGLGTGN